MKQQYMRIVFKGEKWALIHEINEIVDSYRAQGFMLTARQIYYKLVTKNIISNKEQNYKLITKLINDAKLAGYIDWDMIEDRTRAFRGRQRWDSAADILASARDSFHMDMWAAQATRVFAIVEKDALVGILGRACHNYDVPLLSARGYPSGTVLRDFVVNYVLPFSERQHIHVIHLGDHDPSGLDMTRDLSERIGMFCGGNVNISMNRVALNKDQIEEKQPPPNPAKLTDSRAQQYIAQYGRSSWELDALEPEYLDQIITNEITSYIDETMWEYNEIVTREVKQRIDRQMELHS